MAPEIYISGMGCLTAYGPVLGDLVLGLASHSAMTKILPLGKGAVPVSCGTLAEFKEALAPYAAPLLRRKMSRLSKMAVTAAGKALSASGLLEYDHADCGVVLGTAFGSTAQSDLFYGDLLTKGALKVNPGYFPETVPNAPAGQVSIIFGLQGANTTICQQALSSEHALALASDLLASGMARRMVVVGVEEMSPALLGGLQACGQLQKWTSSCPDELCLSGHRTRVGEAAVALILETKESLAGRGGHALARLLDVVTAGAAAWPAVYHEVAPALKRMVAGLDRNDCGLIDAVIAGTSFIKEVDTSHLATLAQLLGPDIAAVLPEYGTGNVMGAGLLRTALAVALVSGSKLPCRSLGARVSPCLPYRELYSGLTGPVRHVLATTVSPGGGAGGVLVGRV
jgi:3-oxoacyl-[acyl-carrier-protein] synthase II